MFYSCDTETTGLTIRHGCRPFFVAICDENFKYQYWEAEVDPYTRRPSFPERFYNEFLSVWNNHPFIFHNLKFDLLALSAEFEDLDQQINFSHFLEDTLILAHCINSYEPHNLKDQACRYCYYPKDDQEILRQAVNSARRKAMSKSFIRTHGEFDIAKPNHPHFPAIKKPDDGWWVFDMWLPKAIAVAEGYPKNHPWHTVVQDYCLGDVFRTMLLWKHHSEYAKHLGVWENYQMRKKLLPVTWRMENHGVHIHTEKLMSEKARYQKMAEEEEDQAKWISGIENINSSAQVAKYLYQDNNLFPRKKTKKGKPSTDQEALTLLRESIGEKHHCVEFIDHYLKAKKARKALDYLDSYDSHRIGNRIYSSINITGTRETRQSTNNPNLQNVGTGREE